MATVPTGLMERELKRLYMRWVHQLPKHQNDLHNYVQKFRDESLALVNKMGGDISRLGVSADFPAPKELDLSLHVGTIYSDMELAAVRAQIATGLNPLDTARALQQAGVDKSYRRLERVARTETVSAYWKNQWDEVDGLGLVMIWSSESGPRTCDYCTERDGLVVADSKIRDHPNGRCTLAPTHPSQVEYRGTLRPDGTIYKDPKWDKPANAPKTASVMENDGSVPHTDPRIIKSMKDMDDFAKGMPAPSSLTPNAAKVVDDYAKGSAYSVNGVLRGQKTIGGRPVDARTKAFSKKFTKDMDKMMDASIIPEDVRVVRALGADSFGGIDELKKLAGQTYTDKGYMSTSLAEKVSSSVYNVKDGVEMEIVVPKGTRAVYMAGESYLRTERELLLDRGTKLAVESVTFDEKTKKWKVKATVIPGKR